MTQEIQFWRIILLNLLGMIAATGPDTITHLKLYFKVECVSVIIEL